MSRFFAAHEWMLAGRYLGARRRRDVVSVIASFSLVGIALGVATLIIVMAVMNGLRQDLLSRILGLSGHAMVHAAAEGDALDAYQAMTARLLAVQGVVQAVPMIRGQVMLTLRGQASGATLTAISSEAARNLPYLRYGLRGGSIDAFQGADAILLGRRLAVRLGAKIGDRISVLSLKSQASASGLPVPRSGSFEVVSIVDLGDPNLDAGAVYLPLEAAQRYFGGLTSVQQIELMVRDPERIDQLEPALRTAAGSGASISTWRDDNAALVSAVLVERNVTFLILALIILVAALNIVSGLIMLVKDKGHDIGILRSMGMSGGGVMRIFFIAGASIGVTGTLIGFALGVLFCAEIEPIRIALMRLSGTARFNPEVNFLLSLPARMEFDEVASAVAMALSLSFLATLYPSWRAARLDPVEALRYE